MAAGEQPHAGDEGKAIEVFKVADIRLRDGDEFGFADDALDLPRVGPVAAFHLEARGGPDDLIEIDIRLRRSENDVEAKQLRHGLHPMKSDDPERGIIVGGTSLFQREGEFQVVLGHDGLLTRYGFER